MPRKYPRHFVTRPSGHYFQATPAMKRAGTYTVTSEHMARNAKAKRNKRRSKV